jgi:lipoprotein signal peptidase
MRNNERVTSEETTAAPEASPDLPARRPRLVLFAITAAVALALDLGSKLLVVANLPQTQRPKRVLGGLFYLQQTRNSGAAFSLGTGFTVILTAVALGVVVFIVRTAGRMRSTGWAIALGLILGGALGNLADRLFRSPGFLRGHVVDWISAFGPDAEHWPIFNLADSAIVCGAITAAALALFGIDIDGRGGRHARE